MSTSPSEKKKDIHVNSKLFQPSVWDDFPMKRNNRLMNYIIQYGNEETTYLLKQQDETFFKKKVIIKAYKTFKKLYTLCIDRLNKNENIPIIKIPSIEQIKEEIKKKYGSLEDRLK